MKFGKWLQQQIRESLPAWRDKFILYKELKKLVNLVSSPPSDPAAEAEAEAELLRLLDSEIDKFNDFFQDREEYYVICQQVDFVVLQAKTSIVICSCHDLGIAIIGVGAAREDQNVERSCGWYMVGPFLQRGDAADQKGCGRPPWRDGAACQLQLRELHRFCST